MLNVPNILSLVRILLVPLLVVALLTHYEGKEFVALGLFLAAAFTDFLDGWWARRKRQITRLGKLLDPVADKILMSAAFISLVELGVAPAWMVVLIVAREFGVSALRSLAAAEGMVLAAGVSGKVKTVVHMAAVVVCILHERLVEVGSLAVLTPILLWAAVLAAVVSGVDYFVRFGKVLVDRPLDAEPGDTGLLEDPGLLDGETVEGEPTAGEPPVRVPSADAGPPAAGPVEVSSGTDRHREAIR